MQYGPGDPPTNSPQLSGQNIETLRQKVVNDYTTLGTNSDIPVTTTPAPIAVWTPRTITNSAGSIYLETGKYGVVSTPNLVYKLFPPNAS